MLKNRSWPVWAIASILLLAGTWAAAAMMPDASETDVQPEKVRVKRVVVDCDGEDCGGENHAVKIFIGEGGQHHAVEGDGDGHVWISADGDRAQAFAFAHAGHHRSGGFLGVGLSQLTPELRGHFGVPEDAGVMVSKIVEDSPAARAGIRVGDIITAVNGEAVASGAALAKAIRAHEDGEVAAIEISRDGTLINLATEIEVREGSAHAGGLHMIQKRIEIRCDDDGNCDHGVDAGGFDCGGAEHCEVRVQCGDSGCDCTVNGETSDCSTIPGVPHHGE